MAVTCDVVVVGSGGAGLTAAVTARKLGLDVLLVEKAAQFGGTTATSGGTIWVPLSGHADPAYPDSAEAVHAYLAGAAANYIDHEKVDAFLANGPEMIAFLEKEASVGFVGSIRPDYHSSAPGAGKTRSLSPKEVHGGILGRQFRNLKPMLPQTLFLGIGVGSVVEMQKFFSAGRSLKSLSYVLGQMALGGLQYLRYGRNARLTRGGALIASLVRAATELGVPIWLSSPAEALLAGDGKVRGLRVRRDGETVDVTARRGVILATGGFPGDEKRTRALYPFPVAGGRATPTPAGNAGDGARLAESVGGAFDAAVLHAAAWMPISIIPGRKGDEAAFPHLVDRQKAGFIAVTRKGRRFVDETCSYHDFVPAMVAACDGADEVCAYLICDRKTINRWGMGFVKPFPVPKGPHLRSGYLITGKTIAGLAEAAGIDAATLRQTVERFNLHAGGGEDPEFGRGTTEFGRYMGDVDREPNPNVAPIEHPPFYAVKLVPSEIATFAGIKTDRFARVLTAGGEPIEGLFAVGNDMASVIGGFYPGAGTTLGPGMTFAYIAARFIAGRR